MQHEVRTSPVLTVHGAPVQTLGRGYIVSGELSFGVLASATEASLFTGGTYLQGSTNLRGNTVVNPHDPYENLNLRAP